MAETKQKPRIDVVDLSETLEVLFNGEIITRSSRAKVLFEGSLPARYYVPASDVRLELLRPTATKTHCPWKGEANYFSIEVGGKVAEDAVWSYRNPIPEMTKIAGLLSFYPERVDKLHLV
ncbi:DUF427 domain-containing protein [Algihabitans albus]|uniref:DUF427 domain-containing protein n=1 Tax=Algihabitans albus TaxID=2164067 RepID=UPI000E5C67EA|nr:DUF427 domain-containing protein [Algihabitans albus]